jgi:hypothetical protein
MPQRFPESVVEVATIDESLSQPSSPSQAPVRNTYLHDANSLTIRCHWSIILLNELPGIICLMPGILTPHLRFGDGGFSYDRAQVDSLAVACSECDSVIAMV